MTAPTRGLTVACDSKPARRRSTGTCQGGVRERDSDDSRGEVLRFHHPFTHLLREASSTSLRLTSSTQSARRPGGTCRVAHRGGESSARAQLALRAMDRRLTPLGLPAFTSAPISASFPTFPVFSSGAAGAAATPPQLPSFSASRGPGHEPGPSAAAGTGASAAAPLATGARAGGSSATASLPLFPVFSSGAAGAAATPPQLPSFSASESRGPVPHEPGPSAAAGTGASAAASLHHATSCRLTADSAQDIRIEEPPSFPAMHPGTAIPAVVAWPQPSGRASATALNAAAEPWCPPTTTSIEASDFSPAGESALQPALPAVAVQIEARSPPEPPVVVARSPEGRVHPSLPLVTASGASRAPAAPGVASPASTSSRPGSSGAPGPVTAVPPTCGGGGGGKVVAVASAWANLARKVESGEVPVARGAGLGPTASSSQAVLPPSMAPATRAPADTAGGAAPAPAAAPAARSSRPSGSGDPRQQAQVAPAGTGRLQPPARGHEALAVRLRPFRHERVEGMHFADRATWPFGFGECVVLPEDAFAADGAPTFCTEAPRNR